jgi:hypothetical protein
MAKNIRCTDCRHYRGFIGWCENARKTAGGKCRRNCEAFQWTYVETPSNGNTSAGMVVWHRAWGYPKLIPRYRNPLAERRDH